MCACGTGVGEKVAGEQQNSEPAVHPPVLGHSGFYLANCPGIQGWMVAKSSIFPDSELQNLAGW